MGAALARALASLKKRQAVPYDSRYQRVIRYLVQRGYDFRSNSTAVTPVTTYFFYAVRFHFILDAIQLIRLGANVNIVGDEKDQSPLQFAVVNKSHVEVLDIIPNGFQYSMMHFYGLESLKLATDARDRIRIEELAASRCEEAFDSEASLQSQRNLVKMMLDAGATVNRTDLYDCAPIQCAVYTGDLELVTMLINAGADVNNQNALGASALHDAVLCCHEEMVLLLLSRGADVSIETEKSNTALHWATMLNIGNSHEGIIRKLLEIGGELLYEPNLQGKTPFNYIVQCCDVDLVRLCVEKYRAELKKPDHAGHNALLYAAWNVNTNVFEFVLKSAEIVIDFQTHYGKSLFASACEASMLSYVKWLISIGADVNALDKHGTAPLFYCITMTRIANSKEIVPFVLIRDNFVEERQGVMRLLLECGSNVNLIVEDSDNKQNRHSLLQKLINEKDSESLHIIIEHVAQVEARLNEQLFNDDNLRLLKENPVTKSYYEKCLAELAAMRSANVGTTTITYFSVLTEPLDVVARYTRNEDFVKTFEAGEYQTVYCSFASRFKDKFHEAAEWNMNQQARF